MSFYVNVLGMNARNALIDTVNPVGAQQIVDQKQKAKEVLQAAGVPVTPTIQLLRDRLDIERFDLSELPDSWAVKPNMGAQGDGVLLAAKRTGPESWESAGGKSIARDDLLEHLHLIAGGEFSSSSTQQDCALIEPLLKPHPLLKKLSSGGLPDIRVICWQHEPIMAMVRLPSEDSDGRANLHQGAVGVAISIETGRTTRAEINQEQITTHPDTGVELCDVEIPYWQEILEMSVKASKVLELGYVGLDITIDEEKGPILIEGNAHPGLEIQNVNGTGLRRWVAAEG